MNRQELNHAIATVIKSRLNDADPDMIAELAKSFWYDDGQFIEEARSVAKNKSLSSINLKRLAYTVDFLRKFDCYEPSKNKIIREFIAQFNDLIIKEEDPKILSLLNDRKIDKISFKFGLDESFGIKFQKALEYQTRHYADSIGKSYC